MIPNKSFLQHHHHMESHCGRDNLENQNKKEDMGSSVQISEKRLVTAWSLSRIWKWKETERERKSEKERYL